MRIYAIGDIHGQLDMLRDAHDRIQADREACGDANAPVVHLGDLVDRGPNARGVLDFLIRNIADGAPWIVLKGNHDRMFQLFMEDAAKRDPRLRSDLGWLNPRLGGNATLASYGVEGASIRRSAEVHDEALQKVPRDHHRFVGGLPLMHTTLDLIFVHAGIRPGIPLGQQTEDDLVWIREGFLEDTTDHGRLVVHGHTVVPLPTHYGNRVALDTGAGFGDPMTAAVFEGRDCFILSPDGGREPLPAPF